MSPQQLELRVHQIVATVLPGDPWGDDMVEVKATLIEPRRFARRLGAHANTAHGHTIIWIIGLDERNRSVTGIPSDDKAEWWP